MRIALVTETFVPSTDGVVTRLTFAVKYLVGQGHDVLVIAPGVEGLPDIYAGARVVGMPVTVFSIYPSRAWSFPTSKIKPVLEQFGPDIVHVANPVLLGASAVYYASKLNIPLICSFHTNLPKYLEMYHLGALKPMLWFYLQSLHNKAALNLVTSQAMREELEAQDIRGVTVLPRGVDTERRHPQFEDAAMRLRLCGGQRNKKLLIFVGRLAPEKEIHKLRKLLDARDDVCLAIVGDGPEREALEALFEGTYAVFTGFLHGEELSRAYASADAFVFPSVSETLGLVILEAMASGTPVLAAASAPTLEQIRHKVNGLIFRDEDPESMEEAVDLLYDEELMEAMRDRARGEAEQFSWDRASARILDAYERTLALSDREAIEVNE